MKGGAFLNLNTKSSAFSLVECLVALAILAVVAGAACKGFGWVLSGINSAAARQTAQTFVDLVTKKVRSDVENRIVDSDTPGLSQKLQSAPHLLLENCKDRVCGRLETARLQEDDRVVTARFETVCRDLPLAYLIWTRSLRVRFQV